jgi:magnesium-transporting ATPase (P-type)
MINQTKDFLNRASTNGLRTLCMAIKIVDEQSVDELFQKIEAAEKDL